MDRFHLPLLLKSALVPLLLAGCNFPGEMPGPLPTEQVPTAIAMTLAAQGITLQPAPPSPASVETTAPTDLPETTPTETRTPTHTPIDTPTAAVYPGGAEAPPPEGIPPGTVQFLSPGPGSLVTSPFLLRASLRPGPSATVRVELLGEDGRLLMREVKAYDLPLSQGVLIGQEITFAISAVAETARLQLIVEDEYNRLAAVASLDLLLLSLGDPDLAQAGDGLENIVINAPRENALIQGGVVRVSGLARLRSAQPLLIELRDRDGRIVGTRQAAVTPIPGSSYGAFEIDVPYTVANTTRVRLAVWEPGVEIPGIVHLSSREIVLSP